MKKKELNTFIQDKLDAENGIPFKDEYWNQMNNLLDANLPVNNVATAAKATSSILKIVSISVTSVMLISASIFSYSYFNSKNNSPKTTLNTSLNNPAPVETTIPAPNANMVQGNGQTTLIEPLQNKYITKPTELESSTQTTSTTNKLASSSLRNYAIGSVKNNTKPNQLMAKPIVDENKFDFTDYTNSNENFAIEQMPQSNEMEEYSNTKKEFNFIDSRLPNFSLETPALALHPTTLLTNPNRNSVVKHLNVSAFVGAIHQAQGNTIQSYTLPTQTNFTYGISIESTIKRISIRTGLAMSNCTINLTTQYLNNVYTVDTTYKIINPNYGTTPSGKPIALVQKHLDTTSVTTTTYAKENSYTYQILSIPTTLEYKIPLNRFTLILEGGALHHIRVAQQSNAPIQVTSGETKTSFPSYTMQVCAGGGLRYALNLNWAIGVNYLYSLNPSQTSLHLVNNAQQGNISITRYIW